MKVIATMLTGFLTLCLLSPAGAQNNYLALGKGSDQPIEIRSKKFFARNIPDGKEALFERAVKVTQEDVTLTCERLVVVYDEKKAAGSPESRSKESPREAITTSTLRSITASGNVKITQNDRTAIAGKAVYDNVKRTITLSESPRLWQAGGRMAARTIIIHLDKNLVETVGGDENDKEKGKDGEIVFTINSPEQATNPGQQKKDKEKPSPAQGN